MRLDAVSIIKNRLSMEDILAKYGYETKSKGFMCCPFHSEKTPSFKVYKGNGGWHCFGCGESGDQIKFVQQLFGLSFFETLKRIDADFCLGLFDKPTLAEYRKMQKQSEERKSAQEKEKSEREKIGREYWAAFDRYAYFEMCKRVYAPKTGDEELHPKFIDALQNIGYAEYMLEQAEIRRWIWNNERSANKVYANN